MRNSGRTPSVESFLAPRQGSQGDAAEMGRIAYRAVDLAQPRATLECLRILREPFAFSAVVERRAAFAPDRMVGVLNGVLLMPWFSELLLGSRDPYFHLRVEEADASPFPDQEGVGRANEGAGLDMFLAHFAVDGTLSDGEAIRARGMLIQYFVDQFSGNRVRRILVETIGRENAAMALNGGFEVVTTYPRWRAEHGVLEREGPHLLRIDLERAMEVQNFHVARLLQYRPPVFRFPPVARELLRFALEGLTDPQLSEEKRISSKALASTWTRIYRIVGEVMPSLLPSGDGGKTTRRMALLAYLRHHPEEVWPYGGS